MQEPVPLRRSEIPDLMEFLGRADLTFGGLEAATVRLWLLRGQEGRVWGSTGYKLSDDRRHALVRSVAVDSSRRGHGLGAELARSALKQAAGDGAERAWLFSRRSGPFWQRLGFEPANRDALVEVLGATQQVKLFQLSGQLQREVAWSRSLEADQPSV